VGLETVIELAVNASLLTPWTVLAVQGWLSQLESGTAEGLGRGLGAGPSRLEAVTA